MVVGPRNHGGRTMARIGPLKGQAFSKEIGELPWAEKKLRGGGTVWGKGAGEGGGEGETHSHFLRQLGETY